MDNLYVMQDLDLDGYKIQDTRFTNHLTFGEIHDQLE